MSERGVGRRDALAKRTRERCEEGGCAAHLAARAREKKYARAARAAAPRSQRDSAATQWGCARAIATAAALGARERSGRRTSLLHAARDSRRGILHHSELALRRLLHRRRHVRKEATRRQRAHSSTRSLKNLHSGGERWSHVRRTSPQLSSSVAQLDVEASLTLPLQQRRPCTDARALVVEAQCFRFLLFRKLLKHTLSSS